MSGSGLNSIPQPFFYQLKDLCKSVDFSLVVIYHIVQKHLGGAIFLSLRFFSISAKQIFRIASN